MTLKDKLQELHSSRGCLLATNFYNFETLAGIIASASLLQQPIILQVTKASIDYLSLPMVVGMAKAAFAGHEAGGWLHLDHAESYDLIARCLDAGFDSVMIDYSEQPFDENVAMTTKIVKLAEQYNANVEAELGYVAKLGQSKEKLGFTEPEEAKRFVSETGVHALAVAIGSAHGFYKATPKLDLERLSAIKEATQIPLVLHGGSGIPANTLRESIRRGICKINLATEIKDTFMRNLHRLLAENNEIDLRKVFPPAIQAVSALVKEKLGTVSRN
ncbi:class II fructose-bisphosphate aldolase [Parapedobacter indicus]|uniref:Fructose-bisphosphate aldolase, class II/tagatose 1,6-diphosphate aldolase GatY/KbaY n=1 Tax=Parapedobacter indicus TaxID=1477437 RepID=A0A1I3KCP7_9SPHI|nr:class II fructose-bisphosphate aldolase [Parapedobacter indicus]PPL01782.1 fructose-bisphosphate aldolase class II/tagatose 1,6-diphosphate aldolase GatY/KbaY [Parapedobacter indicus]SFI70262.1 fructose-bisphosphate aldolase, class II/tagatose 1,6-diphosphate aldolase GatY/KbaY [Parapedobacter indicus]